MDFTKGAGKAISSVLILFFSLLFAVLIIDGFDLSITAGIIISMIFMVMVIEDHLYLTVDLQILGILAFAGIFTSHFRVWEYFMLLICGLLYYRIIYLVLIKYVPKEKENNSDTVIDTSKALGFLPSLATGLAIYAFYRIASFGNYPQLLRIFYESCNDIYVLIFSEPLCFFYLLIPFLILWGILELRRYKSEKNEKVAVPMLGDGDVYVLAVWLAILGLADMTMALFISIIVQALAFVYRDTIQNKFQIGGK